MFALLPLISGLLFSPKTPASKWNPQRLAACRLSSVDEIFGGLS